MKHCQTRIDMSVWDGFEKGPLKSADSMLVLATL